MNLKLEERPTTLSVTHGEFHEAMAQIDAAGGFVFQLKPEPTGYVLTIQWPANTAGDAPGYKAETPPVQHESVTTEEPLP